VSGPFRATVNGGPVERSDVDDSERLLDTLRWRLGLKGTKEGCRTGDCGACTVLVDGESTLACLTLTREVEGARITTIEGIREEPAGPKVLIALGAEPALQCGYCTPGFVLALTGLLQEAGSAHRTADLVDELEGNLCRCTGYRSIIRAIGALGGKQP
jgi:carbon-monoxide dehydrogenase small subunit